MEWESTRPHYDACFPKAFYMRYLRHATCVASAAGTLFALTDWQSNQLPVGSGAVARNSL